MIKAEYGEVMVKGTGMTIMADFTAVIRAIRDMLMEDLTEEEAREEIAFCQELAFKTDEESKEETEKTKAMIEQAKAEYGLERIGRRYEN